MKKLDINAIPAKLRPLLHKVRYYLPLIFIVVAAMLYGFLVFRIKTLASQEPTEDAVAEKIQASPHPRIDQDALNKIQQLQDNSTDVQALFKHARDNPFQE